MKRNKIFAIAFLAVFTMGCSPKVRFESTKPIKIDVSMRIDVYQHVAKQADFIENQIESTEPAQNPQAKPQSFLNLTSIAYAQEELSPKIKGAVDSRKARVSYLRDWESKGVIGENHRGFVEVRNSAAAGSNMSNVQQIIADENKDRQVIYKDISENNGISVEEAGIAYAPRIQQGAPGGTPIEIEANGKYQWTTK
ncbi:MAG: DUF1318 domain-containing protein [Candidatus Omnitrophica bacterium]|nr:DUF1318 domain-containing protein [Candidatus Omnitrophota bacterium]